ncbi:MAG: cadherin-like domain-containing protein, partial [Pirellulaceae bacterium]
MLYADGVFERSDLHVLDDDDNRPFGEWFLLVERNNAYSRTTAVADNPPGADNPAPTVSSLSPSDNATGVALDSNLVVTFDENIRKGSGNIVLKKSSDNSVVETISVGSSRVTVSGRTATIDPATTLAGSTGYYVQVASGAFEDLTGNGFAGINNSTTWNFTTDDAYEENNSLATAYYPGSNWEQGWLNTFAGPGIQKDDDWFQIDITPGFERLVVDLTFTHADGDIDVAVYDADGRWVTSSTSGTDNESIDHILPGSGTFYLKVFNDNKGNAYNLWWDDLKKPLVVSSLSPADDATDVALDSNLVVTFDESVLKGSGDIVLKTSSDNSVVETISVGSSRVTVSGRTVTIDPATALAEGVGYYVQVASGTFKDPSGNDFVGFTDATTWNFMSRAIPVIGNQSATLAEGAALTLTGSHLSATDADSDDAALMFALKSVPANGQVKKDGTILAANDTFTQADVTSGKIRYTHDDSNTISDNFTFTVKDPPGNEIGPEPFAITITPVDDDTPVVGNQSATLTEGATLTLAGSHLSATDTDSDDAALIFTVKSIPTGGELKKDGTVLTANATFTQADITSGKLSYTYNDSNTITDSFTFTVKDSAGNETGSATFSITVDDDAPVVGNQSATLAEGATLTLTGSHLSATDVDTEDAALTFTLQSVPANGALKKDGTMLAAGGTFTQAEVTSGKLSYTHDDSNTTSDRFTFTVKDPPGKETGTATFAITITPVDDDTPVVSNQSATLAEGATLTLAASHLSATDADTEDATLIFTVQSVPANGELKKEG